MFQNLDGYVKLTVIIDNYVLGSGLKAEHGWSILIEEGRERILFDCGQTSQVIENAKALNINLDSIDKIILSHGHYDHTGGLLDILKAINKSINVYAHPDIFEEKYISENNNLKKRYIGIPKQKSIFEENGAKFILNKEPIRLNHHIYLTGQIPRVTSFEKVEKDFLKKINSEFVHDEIYDDNSIVIDTPKGLILILGCAHSGVINIIERTIEITGKDSFLAIIGGFHFMDKDDDYVNKTMKRLKNYKIGLVSPTHCSGINSLKYFAENFGKGCIFGKVGKVIEFKI